MSRNKLHLFNPENDLALALGCRHYTPPPHAAQLHRAGALLPAWWANDNDCIIAPYEWAEADAAWLRERWGLTPTTVADPHPYRPAPWGWSDDARRQFILAGMDEASLPASDTIATLRMLSHRRSSIAILSALGCDDLLPEEVTDPARVLQLEAAKPGRFLKSPWSCSGRGVFCAQGLPPKVLADKAAGIIHRQGSVMVERGYKKIAEFGALFTCNDSEGAKFRGLSMFLTEQRGAYTGNIVAPQDYFLSQIDSLRLSGKLDETTSRLENILTRLLSPHYNGWLGIDMMAYEGDDGKPRLHPCIELNLRMTMGIVAMKIADRLAPATPHLQSWQRTAPGMPEAATAATPCPTLLLPPHEGFALTLEKILQTSNPQL